MQSRSARLPPQVIGRDAPKIMDLSDSRPGTLDPMPKDAAVALLDLPVGRWSVDATLLSCNAAYERAAGEPLSALRGRTLADLHGEDFWSQAREAFISASAGRSAHIDHRAARPNLGPRWCRLMLLPERDARARVAAPSSVWWRVK